MSNPAAHVFPVATQQLAQKAVDWQGGTVDTLKVLLIGSGTFNWVAATQAYTTVAQFLANAGSGGGTALTEVSTTGTGYSRATLSGVATSTSGLVTSLTATSPVTWSSATFSASYALFYDTLGGSTDTTAMPICYWDFLGAVSCSNGTFTLNLGSGNALVQYTAS